MKKATKSKKTKRVDIYPNRVMLLTVVVSVVSMTLLVLLWTS